MQATLAFFQWYKDSVCFELDRTESQYSFGDIYYLILISILIYWLPHNIWLIVYPFTPIIVVFVKYQYPSFIFDTVFWKTEALIWNIGINCGFASHFPGYLWSVPLKEGKKGSKEVVVLDCESIVPKVWYLFKSAPYCADTFQRLARFRFTALVCSGPTLNIKCLENITAVLLTLLEELFMIYSSFILFPIWNKFIAVGIFKFVLKLDWKL
jgi:hypothetical protein